MVWPCVAQAAQGHYPVGQCSRRSTPDVHRRAMPEGSRGIHATVLCRVKASASRSDAEQIAVRVPAIWMLAVFSGVAARRFTIPHPRIPALILILIVILIFQGTSGTRVRVRLRLRT